MSDTPTNTNECTRLLDNGWIVKLYRNRIGSYTAMAYNEENQKARVYTDDFTPEQALCRLTEKVFGNVV
jgi:hypothetical protein